VAVTSTSPSPAPESSDPHDFEAPTPGAGGAGEAEERGAGATTAELTVQGMHCGACVALIEESLTDRAGVTAASVDLDSARAVVHYDPSLVDPDDLRATIAEAGYSATMVG
jgi:copper chaperone CopZ